MGRVIIYPSYMDGALPPISSTVGQTVFDAGQNLSSSSLVFVDEGLFTPDQYTISGTLVTFNVGLLEGQKVTIVP